MEIAEVARLPAPALHVDQQRRDQAVLARAAPRPVHGVARSHAQHAARRETVAALEILDRLGEIFVVIAGIVGRRHAEPLADQLHVAVAVAGPQRWSLGNAAFSACRSRRGRTSARGEQLPAQRLELRVARMVRAKLRGRRLLRLGEIGESVIGIGTMRVQVHVVAHRQGRDPAGLGVTRISQHGDGKPQFGLRQPFGRIALVTCAKPLDSGVS